MSRLTPAQRNRKVAAARRHAAVARDLLREVHDTLNTDSFANTAAEDAEWREVVRVLGLLEKIDH